MIETGPPLIKTGPARDDEPPGQSLTLIADGFRAWAGARMSQDNLVARWAAVESLGGVNMRERWAGTRPGGASRPAGSRPAGSRPNTHRPARRH